VRPPFLVSKSIECSRERVFEKFFAEAEQKVKLHFCIAELLLFPSNSFSDQRIPLNFCLFKHKKREKFFSLELTKTHMQDCGNDKWFLKFACICVRFDVQSDINSRKPFVHYDFV